MRTAHQAADHHAPLAALRRNLLESLAGGAQLDEVLREICELVEEELVPPTRCTILVAEDGHFTTAYGPNIDDAYRAAIKGLKVGENSGSCGAAISRGEPVYVPDALESGHWPNPASIERYRIEAVWSTPVFGRDERGAVGSVAIYTERGLLPTEQQADFLRGVADFVGLFIAEHRLRSNLDEQRTRLNHLLDGANIGVWEIYPQTGVTFLDNSCQRLLGVEPGELDQTTQAEVRAMIDPQDLPRLDELSAQMIAGKSELLEAEFRVRDRDGQWIWLMDRARIAKRDSEGQPLLVVGTMQDITARKKRDEELRRVQRIDSLGKLAGGIAHDFNNILVAIFGGVENALTHISDDHEVARDLALVTDSLERARQLSGQLLTFAKGGEPIVGEFDLVELVDDLQRFVLANRNMTAELDAPDDLWGVRGDRGQISQVFANLFQNAFDASSAGGHLSVKLENYRAHNEYVVWDGPYIQAAIRDTGDGIQPEHLEKIFEPYFTTKEAGQGLGLATVNSILERHGGSIDVDSIPGQGTTFTILLPATGISCTKARSVVHKHPGEVGHLRVLVVDDEPTVRRVCQSMLARMGHEVVAVERATTALDVYFEAQVHGAPFDIVVMDLTIPGDIGGEEATRRLLHLHPEACVIASSGYADNPIMASPSDHGFQAVLPKPYTYAELSNLIGSVVRQADTE